MIEKNVVGTAPLADGEDEANKLIDIWKFYLHDGIPPSKDAMILWLLYVLLTRTMSCEEKFRILEKEFEFKLTEEVESMCSFTETVRREGKREGKIEGIEESQLLFFSNLKKAGIDDNTICSYMSISMHKLAKLKKLLATTASPEPQTV